jgi:hypothetical protein
VGIFGTGFQALVHLKQHHTSTLECKWEVEKIRESRAMLLEWL